MRNRPSSMGIHTTTCHQLASILADFNRNHDGAVGPHMGHLLLAKRRVPVYTMWTTLGDLVEMLDGLSDKEPLDAKTLPSLFDAAAKAVARTLP
ncbi:hypothetical protein psal_cds_759 [Pandoravirus salinus]|uniref:Uncharacterized protein n=1 Tax=Pandoravirus salinus TaxID=1349410 RepID=S4VZ29_9VIRU|nr:hypothetical protein psal_cds_759 [Pandoravirus salinus]AGO84751.1 hypothetical protein psal_cds_759 [Pandoravirus salinus]